MTDSTPPAATSEPEPLRVALDLRLINNSGIGSYLTGLLGGFVAIRAPIAWTFIGPKCEIPDGLTVQEWIEFDAPLYSQHEFWHYPKTPNADLFHYPHYNLPRVSPSRRVVTVFDLFHLKYGSFAKRAYQRLFLSRLAWSGAQIAAISAKTSEELLAATSIAPDRVRVIHPGPGRTEPTNARTKPTKQITLSDGRTVRPPWLLTLGIDQPHKNVDFLLAATAMWYLRRGEGPPLIWMGPKSENLRERTLSIPAQARQNIYVEPYTPSGERVEELLAGAAALVFPSLDEGFGLPPLEAMARGIPVISSRRRPMTDLLGDAPLWFDPADSATLWRALDMLSDNPSVADAASANGRKQASKYSWAKCAEETLKLYRDSL